ncbi:MAG: hypothetical protein E7067_04890 [Lentimicrobiaceae bacterium]|nr:hypothetical protein [Lentimicrobiaceae bacterium]
MLWRITMLDYPVKILMALAMTFDEEGEPFHRWLLENGYPELAALSDAIKGSDNATEWLMKNKYYHLVAFDAAIDNKAEARKWLERYNYPILILLADAINHKESSIKYLIDNKLDIYVVLSQKIRKALTKDSFNPYKINF